MSECEHILALHMMGSDKKKCLRCGQIEEEIALRATVKQQAGELKRLNIAMSKINDIRNSIIGAQTMNWSEHIYPLVAALNDAGFRGLPYPEARKNVGTLIERVEAAEARVTELEAALENIREYWNGLYNETAMTDALHHIIATADAVLRKEE